MKYIKSIWSQAGVSDVNTWWDKFIVIPFSRIEVDVEYYLFKIVQKVRPSKFKHHNLLLKTISHTLQAYDEGDCLKVSFYIDDEFVIEFPLFEALDRLINDQYYNYEFENDRVYSVNCVKVSFINPI